MRLPLMQFFAICAGSAIVLGLFLARGFSLHEHARILLTASALCGLVGAGWALTGAAEMADGWRRLGAPKAVLIVAGAVAAAFLPAFAVWLAQR